MLNDQHNTLYDVQCSPLPTKNGLSFKPAAIVATGTLIFAIGGFRKRDAGCAACYCFDTDSKSWRKMPDIPTPRMQHKAVYFDGGIFTLGGQSVYKADNGVTTCYENLGTVETFELSTWRWRTQPSLSIKSWNFAVAGLADYLYVLGGAIMKPSGTRTYIQRMQRFEKHAGRGGRWKQLPGPPTLRDSYAAVAAHGRLWAFGVSSRAVESYDPSSGVWSRHQGLHYPLNSLSACAVADRIFLLGDGKSHRQEGDDRVLEEQLPGVSVDLIELDDVVKHGIGPVGPDDCLHMISLMA